MTSWGAIAHLLASVAQLEQRQDTLEAELKYWKAKEKAPLVAGPEETVCVRGCCYGPNCLKEPACKSPPEN